MAAMKLFLVVIYLVSDVSESKYVTDEEFQDLSALVFEQAVVIRQLRNENTGLSQRMTTLEDECGITAKSASIDLFLNETIEERVAFLETQVDDLEEDVSEVDEEVIFLFDQQVIQDERLLNLEENSTDMETELENLQAVIASLDDRLTTVEVTTDEHGTSIRDLENSTSLLGEDVGTLDKTVSDLGLRLLSAEENIEGLQTTDVSLNERITVLEDSQEIIAFSAALTDYSTISIGATILFDEVLINQGNGYNSATGVLTVPPGGGGFYYFSVYFQVDLEELAVFEVRVNDGYICRARGDHTLAGEDASTATCSSVTQLAEGDEIWVQYEAGTDNTPLYTFESNFYNGFTGFKI